MWPAVGVAVLAFCVSASSALSAAPAAAPAPKWRAKMTSDGRRLTVIGSKDGVGPAIVDRVVAAAKEAQAAKGSFVLAVGSGSTVAPLSALTGCSDIDFDHFHVVFGNERTEGDAAFKCADGAQRAFVEACGIPAENVYRANDGVASLSAVNYENKIRDLMPRGVARFNPETRMPALDLILLGSGADGHTASLYPASRQVVDPGHFRSVVPAEGKGGITMTLPLINSAQKVLISATKPEQAQMVATAFEPGSARNVECPAGMIAASDTTDVEWLLSEESALLLDF